MKAEVAFSVARSVMSQIQLGGRVNRECESTDSVVYVFRESFLGGRFTINPAFEEFREIAHRIIVGGGISDADVAADTHMTMIKKTVDALDGVDPDDYEDVSKKSRLIADDRGTVLCGPKAVDIADRIRRRLNGSKCDLVQMNEISKNSVSRPARSNGIWEDCDFEEVHKDCHEMYLYRGGYDSGQFGIWKDKMSLL